ncbi:MAG: hypothetical protein GYA02_04490 [Clostridiaceae bacterium]|jgi:uroporphyrinogen decarboxylase|nr:hypothetical protein [Clostridiaceae bacterium]
MNSREVIKRIIEFNDPERIGLDFNFPNFSDIAWITAARLKNYMYDDRLEWGAYDQELKLIPGLTEFNGEVRWDAYGNIYGRLNQKTKGECIKGALQDGWEKLKEYEMPLYDETYEIKLMDILQNNKEKFLLGALPISPFSTMRDLRRIDNLLMDVVLEEDMVMKLLEKVEKLAKQIIRRAASLGFDGVVIYDDWGTQKSLLINPIQWRRIFKPVYTRLADEIHKGGMKFFVHSCGFVYEIIQDFIEAGVDVLQFDQPELIGVEKLANEFGGKVTFWCPVDIQMIMSTGDRKLIEDGAKKMIEHFGKLKGGFIAKDYPSWEDINVKDEWAQWARDVFVSEGFY